MTHHIDRLIRRATGEIFSGDKRMLPVIQRLSTQPPLTIDFEGSDRAISFIVPEHQAHADYHRRLSYNFIGFGYDGRDPGFALHGRIGLEDDDMFAYLFPDLGLPLEPHNEAPLMSALCSFNVKPVSGEVEGLALHISTLQSQAQQDLFSFMKISREEQRDFQERIGFMEWAHILVHTAEQLALAAHTHIGDITCVTLPTHEVRGRSEEKKFAAIATRNGYTLAAVNGSVILIPEPRYTKPISEIVPDYRMQTQLAERLS